MENSLIKINYSHMQITWKLQNTQCLHKPGRLAVVERAHVSWHFLRMHVRPCLPGCSFCSGVLREGAGSAPSFPSVTSKENHLVVRVTKECLKSCGHLPGVDLAPRGAAGEQWILHLNSHLLTLGPHRAPACLSCTRHFYQEKSFSFNKLEVLSHWENIKGLGTPPLSTQETAPSLLWSLVIPTYLRRTLRNVLLKGPLSASSSRARV